MTEGRNFTTTEFLLAAFLRVKGHELVDMLPNLNGDGRVTFVFRNNDQIGRDTQNFIENGLVPVKSLSRQIARLRDAVREMREQQRRARGATNEHINQQ